MNGKIRMINIEKGFGFIRVSSEEQDIFFHASECGSKRSDAKKNFSALEEGAEVEFIVAQGRRGREAREITIL